MKLSICCAALLVLTGCSNDMQRHGYNFDNDSAMRIEPYKTTASEVLTKMGSPTSAAIYGEPKFFYIQHIYERKKLSNPLLKEQKILEITFTANGLVKENKYYSTNDMKNTQFSKEYTVLPGNEVGVMEQIMGNIGKYNNASNARKVGT